MEVIDTIKLWMEGEINTCIKVWLTVFVCLCYCYFAGKIIPKGPPRLFTLLPVVYLNLILPLNLHTLHLGGSTSFFIAWLANFKLLMFAFAKGPLSDPSISLSRFVAIASLPIKIQQDKPNTSLKTSKTGGLNSSWNYAIKFLLIAITLQVYDYTEYLHPKVILAIYSLHIYLGLETLLAIVGTLAHVLLGIDLEPQFHEPYLSTSLQDFWGRRWNIMVTRILHPTVYEPVHHISAWVLGRKWAAMPAIFGSFMVSALMHELIFYYLGRMRPTWEVTWFFLLHGVCLIFEIAIKKALGGREWRIPRIITGPLTVGFVMVTGFWLFFPPFLRFNAMNRCFQEYAAMGSFVKDVVQACTFKSYNNTTTTTT